MTSIRVSELFKIFGPRPDRVVGELREGTDVDALRSRGVTAAVIDANFEVVEGETFVVMGLSGSGKSTLIRMLNGLLSPTSGQVVVDGQDITTMKGKQLRTMRQRTMSMVFQHFALLPHRTVLDNAGYGLQVRGMNNADIDEKARSALTLVGLEGWEDRYPQQLSGGMRQRVGLARALAAGTDVLLMDEAFSALDPLIKREMQDQLVDLQAQLGKTIIFITHDLNEAMRLGDRIAVMRAGRIVQIGTSEQILNEPADDYVSQFVRDVDRSRVLTASSVADAAMLVDAATAPDVAVTFMEQHHADRVFVRAEDRTLLGVLTRTDAEAARDRGLSRAGDAVTHVTDPVAGTTPVHELFGRMSTIRHPLAVVDEREHLLGALTSQQVLRALGQRPGPGGNGAPATASGGGASRVREASDA